MRLKTVILLLGLILVSSHITLAAVIWPPANNQVRFQGTVLYATSFLVVVARDNSDGQSLGGHFRFECDDPLLGCGLLNSGDAILIHAHLVSYSSCRVDGPDDAVKVNFIMRWNGTSWVMVSQ